MGHPVNLDTFKLSVTKVSPKLIFHLQLHPAERQQLLLRQPLLPHLRAHAGPQAFPLPLPRRDEVQPRRAQPLRLPRRRVRAQRQRDLRADGRDLHRGAGRQFNSINIILGADAGSIALEVHRFPSHHSWRFFGFMF